jgi:hypothetical protein
MNTALAADAAKNNGVYHFVVLTNTPLTRVEGTAQYAQCDAGKEGAILVVNTVAMGNKPAATPVLTAEEIAAKVAKRAALEAALEAELAAS